MSEKRSSVESQNAPKRDTVLVMLRDLAVDEVEDVGDDHDHAGQQEAVDAERAGGDDVDQHADERERVGMDAAAPRWRVMIARSGNMQTVPMNPVNVMRLL